LRYAVPTRYKTDFQYTIFKTRFEYIHLFVSIYAMYIEQIYTSCLAQASYFVESDGVAAIVDPIREPEPYLELAAARGARIAYVLETHFHADFVSGHLDLARLTNAKVVFGPGAQTNFPIHNAHDGEILPLGQAQIRVIHTPGHTPESVCYLVIENGKPRAVFTGDTLFVGEVGRPDLLEGFDIGREKQARELYRSLHEKLLRLPDDVVVYPAHGPGSLCGKNIGTEKQSTIGKERAFNYALRPMSEDEFVEMVLNGLTQAPQYFVQNAIINRRGYDSLEAVLERNVRRLSYDEAVKEMESGAVVLDVRNGADFGAGHIPGAYQVGLDGSFAVWAGTVLDISKRMIVVAPQGREREAILRLARVGADNVAGYLRIEDWKQPLATMPNIKPSEITPEKAVVLDVRNEGEYLSGHLPYARLFPLRQLIEDSSSLDAQAHYQIHCAGGYRSVIAASILKARGFENVANVEGGFAAIKAELPVVVPA
jgi:glyoxylase-like metal-dependent hydrolase (beta-lactamase superfamily II)/rhodanese-related sulfurtransferase